MKILVDLFLRGTVMDNLVRGIHALSRWACWLAIVALAAMMLLIFFDVIFRCFGYPIRGAFDVVGLLGVAVVAIPIAYTQTVGGHISIGFISDRFPKGMKRVIDSANCILNLSVYVLLVWQCSLYGKKLWSVGRVSETVQIPLFPFPYLMAFSCGLMCLVLCGEFYSLIRRGERE